MRSIAVPLFLLALIGCAKPAQTPTPAPVKITAFQLYEESKKNPNYLFATYEGQVVEMTGVVIDVSIPKHGDLPMILLAGSSDKAIVPKFVSCLLKRGSDPYKQALPGQTVVLRCTIPKRTEVTLHYWEVISASGNEPQERTLESLIKEFKPDADLDNIHTKYKNTSIIAYGNIDEVGLSSDANRDIEKIYIGKKMALSESYAHSRLSGNRRPFENREKPSANRARRFGCSENILARQRHHLICGIVLS